MSIALVSQGDTAGRLHIGVLMLAQLLIRFLQWRGMVSPSAAAGHNLLTMQFVYLPTAGSRSNALRIPAVCIPQPVAIHTNSKHQCVQTVRATAATAQTAPSSTAAPTTVRQQLPQRQQKSRNSSRTRNSSGTTIRRPQKPKPFLVRIAGRTSDIKAASGAVVKRLRTEVNTATSYME